MAYVKLILRILTGCIAILCALLVLLVIYGVRSNPRKTEAHRELLGLYGNLNIGMKKEEVRALLEALSPKLSVKEFERTYKVNTPAQFSRRNRVMTVAFEDEVLMYVMLRAIDSGRYHVSGDPPDKSAPGVSDETKDQIETDEWGGKLIRIWKK